MKSLSDNKLDRLATLHQYEWPREEQTSWHREEVETKRNGKTTKMSRNAWMGMILSILVITLSAAAISPGLAMAVFILGFLFCTPPGRTLLMSSYIVIGTLLVLFPVIGLLVMAA